MIQEDYVSFETAKVLKEKGFPQDGFSLYYNEEGDEIVWYEPSTGESLDYSKWFAKPSLSLVAKWFREERSIIIQAELYNPCCSIDYETIIYYYRNTHYWSSELIKGVFKTYKEALEVGINKALELI